MEAAEPESIQSDLALRQTLRKHLRLRADAEHDPYAFSVTVSARGVIFFTVTIKRALRESATRTEVAASCSVVAKVQRQAHSSPDMRDRRGDVLYYQPRMSL